MLPKLTYLLSKQKRTKKHINDFISLKYLQILPVKYSELSTIPTLESISEVFLSFSKR